MSQRGEVSLPGLLMSCALLIVVLSASLGMFESFSRASADGTRRTEAQDVARAAADRLARELRNLASPTADQPQAVDAAGPSELVFKTVDPNGPNAGTNATNTRRVRYCLGPAGALQQQTQTWTSATVPPVPSRSGCPAAGWTSTTVVATGIVNAGTPVFSYDAAALTDISQIHVELRVDSGPARNPPATSLSTGVFLRNQNRRPTSSFAATRTAGGLILNGSASVDPEGDPLAYAWFDGAVQVGTGITFTYTGLASGSTHQLRLEVTDPAGLKGASAVQAVTL